MDNDIKTVRSDFEAEVIGAVKYAWLIWVIGGALSTVIGIWLLLSPRASLATLAILFGLGLVFNGLSELANAASHPSPVLGYIMSALFIAAGVLVFVRPVKGLFGLALIVGLSIIITGLGDLIVAFVGRDQIEHWLLLAFLGAIGVITGVLAIAWPKVTVLILALLLGIRLTIFGLVQMGIGLRLKAALEL